VGLGGGLEFLVWIQTVPNVGKCFSLCSAKYISTKMGLIPKPSKHDLAIYQRSIYYLINSVPQVLKRRLLEIIWCKKKERRKRSLHCSNDYTRSLEHLRSNQAVGCSQVPPHRSPIPPTLTRIGLTHPDSTCQNHEPVRLEASPETLHAKMPFGGHARGAESTKSVSQPYQAKPHRWGLMLNSKM
jgi:hypothetical protein